VATARPRRRAVATKPHDAPKAARVYRGQSNHERKEDRRDRLVRAALELFGTAGYAATSIEGICAAAGVTARHFYEHFGSREALLRAIYDDVVADAHHAIMRSLASPAPDATARVERAVAAFVHSYLDDPRRARVACVEIIGVSPEMERHRRTVIHAFASVVEAQAESLAASGSFVARDFGRTGIAMAGAVNELLADWIMRRDRPPVARFAAELGDFFVAALKGASLVPSRPELDADK
jgi:AcrR family transcriptional regulator